MADANGRLPDGVILRPLVLHGDDRGTLRELYRADWVPEAAFRQWNLVRSTADVLRGVHVHPRHADYLHVVDGEMLLGLHDLRPEDATQRTSCFVRLTGEEPQTAYIPPGVCHGFLFPVETLYIYGLSAGWSLDEELGCRFDDPGLRLDWPIASPILSARDARPAHDYAAMRQAWTASRVPA